MESNIAVQILLPIIAAMMMVGIGLSLDIRQFTRLFHDVRPVAVGIAGQIVGLPVVAFGIGLLVSLPPEYSLGILLIAACPGGPTSNMMTHLVKGDTALSISLTAISTLVAVFTIPLVISLGVAVFGGPETDVTLSFVDGLQRMLLLIGLPVGSGMLIRKHSLQVAERIEPAFKVGAIVFLVILVVGLTITQREELGLAISGLGLAAGLLCVGSMTLGYALSRLSQLTPAQTAAIVIEVGIQNGALAIVIAASVIGSPEMALPAGLYSLAMYLCVGVALFYFRFRADSGHSLIDSPERVFPHE